jgi:hypothetical protein
MPLHPDWKEFLRLLNSHGVDYLIGGAHARAVHGIPRYTRDIDIFYRASQDNAARMLAGLRDFGFGSLDITAEDFQAPERVIQLGVAPYRIDLLNSLSGLDFDDAWSDRLLSEIDGVPVAVISIRAFRKNKLAAGRPKDLADLSDLIE